MLKKIGAVCGVALASLAAFAEGESPSFTLDLSQANSVASEMGTKIAALITGPVLTAILTVLGALVVIWAVRFVYSHVTRQR